MVGGEVRFERRAGDVGQRRAPQPPEGGGELQWARGVGSPDLRGVLRDPDEEVRVIAQHSVEAVANPAMCSRIAEIKIIQTLIPILN